MLDTLWIQNAFTHTFCANRFIIDFDVAAIGLHLILLEVFFIWSLLSRGCV